MTVSGQRLLMHEKRGLIMRVANDLSLEWGIASELAAEGAQLAFTYQGGILEKHVRFQALIERRRRLNVSCLPRFLFA